MMPDTVDAVTGADPAPPPKTVDQAKRQILDEARSTISNMLEKNAPEQEIEAYKSTVKARLANVKPPRMPEELAADDKPLIREDPVGTAVGMMAGGGAANLALKGLMPFVTTGVGRVAASGLASAAGGAAGETVRSATAGDSPGEVAENAVEGGKMGAIIGTPLAILSAGARAVRAGLRRGKGPVSTYLNAKDAGAYKAPEMQALPKGNEGRFEASHEAVGKMAARERELSEQAGKNWNMVGANPEVLRRPVDSELIRARLHAARMHHIDPDTGLPTNEAIVAAYDKALGATGMKATVEGTLKRRQALQRAAAFDNPNPTPEQMAARDVYHTFRAAVRDASPELASADDAFSQYEREAAKRSELAGAPDLSNLKPGQEEAVASRVGRLANENVAGMRAKKRLAELRKSDSEFADAMRTVEAKNAQEAVRPSAIPHTPTDLNMATFMAGIPRLAVQNSRALAAHALDPAMRALMEIERPGAVAAIPPFLSATMAAAQKKKKGN